MTNLKMALKKNSMSQTELAKKCGVSLSLCNSHVRFGIKTIRVAQRYATILQCNPLKLIDINK